MTLYHFGNCVALVYLPYHFLYKYSSLSEYGAFWKCMQAGLYYAITQLCKLLVLATFFPDTNVIEANGFDVIGEFLKSTVDLLDIYGIYRMLGAMSGRGQVKILTTGLGWSGAEILFTRFWMLWVGARGSEFDWKYVQKCLESNANVINNITIAALVWMWSRYNAKKTKSQSVMITLISTSFKSFVIDAFVHMLQLDPVVGILFKAITIALFGFATLRLYIETED